MWCVAYLLGGKQRIHHSTNFAFRVRIGFGSCQIQDRFRLRSDKVQHTDQIRFRLQDKHKIEGF